MGIEYLETIVYQRGAVALDIRSLQNTVPNICLRDQLRKLGQKNITYYKNNKTFNLY